jgi:hypothetical protein
MPHDTVDLTPLRLSREDEAGTWRDAAAEISQLIIAKMMQNQIRDENLTIRQGLLKKVSL